MLKALSTRRAHAVVFAVSLVPVAACVDAKGRFDEYDQRLPHIDASNIDSPMVETIPDIDGTWLLAVDPAVAMGAYVQLKVDWNITVNGSTGMLDGSYQPLRTWGITPPVDAPGRTPVGAAITANGVAVDNTASFAAHLVGTLPGDANPVSGTEYPVDIILHGTIRSMDVVCGTVTGSVGPLSADGSTFGAVRNPGASPGTPIGACPAVAVDAGVDAPTDAAIDAP